MPRISLATVSEDGSTDLNIAEWASDFGLDVDGLNQLLGVSMAPRPVQVKKSPATGQGLVSNGHLGADAIHLVAGQSFAPHTHPGDHLLIVIAGQGTIVYDGKIYPTRAGQIYMIEGEKPHAVGAITDHVILAIGCPHKPIDSEDRMELTEYEAITTQVDELHCLICDASVSGTERLHAKGCPHCPCDACVSEA